jgi:hypothetical protein
MSTAAPARSKQVEAFGGMRLLSVIPILIGCLLSVLFFSVALRGIASFAPTTNAEGNQLHGTLRVQSGDALYLNFHEFPSIVTPYTPLYYVATGLASRVFSLDLPETLAFARTITLLAACGVVGMIYALARTNGASQLAAITSASLFLPLPFLDRWAFTSRPDTLAILLSLIAAWIALRWPQWSSVAAIVAVVAFFTKQTSIAVPAAITLWLWFGGNRRSAITFVATWLACVVPTVFALNALTNGNFLLNVFYAHLNPTNGFDAALRTILDLPTFAWPMLLLAALSVAFELRQRKLGLSSIYWLIALAVLLYSLRGRGAAENYFIETSALTCILAASILSKVLRPASGVIAVAPMLAVSAALAIWGWQMWGYWREGGELELDRPTEVPEIAHAERIWAEEPSLVVFAGKPLLVSDPFLLSQMTEAGHFDPTFLADRVRARYFDLILVRGDVRQPRYLNGQLKWPEPVLKAVAEFYQRQGTRGPYWVYVPDRPRSAS